MRRFVGWAVASVTLVLASISVALFYNITFFGKTLVALPSPPVAAGCLLYYLSAFNSTPPVAQVVLWMVSFLLCGWLWWGALYVAWTSRFGSGEAWGEGVSRGLWLWPLVYLIPLPWLLWVHAQSPEGVSLAALQASILVRDGLYWNSQGSEGWLNFLFVVLALVETGGTIAVLRTAPQARWAVVARVVPLAGLGLLVAACGLAEVAARLH